MTGQRADPRYRNLNMLSGAGANCYVIRCIDGDVLIDTGRRSCRDETEVWLTNYDIKLIVLTHGHNDHIENAAYFSELYGVPIVMSRYDVPLVKDNLCRRQYILNTAGRFMYMLASKGMKEKAEYFRADKFAEGGERLCDLGVNEVLMHAKIISLRGHTKGSLGILDGKDLYCGDAMCGIKGMLQVPIAESPKAALQTLRLIAKLSPERIFPGHGEPIIKGDKQYKLLLQKVNS